jgi:cell division topological specificity factor
LKFSFAFYCKQLGISGKTSVKREPAALIRRHCGQHKNKGRRSPAGERDKVNFFRKWFGSGGTPSAGKAKERLFEVVFHDRSDISPRLLEKLRDEIIAVLTKYMEIDKSKIEMDLDRNNQKVVFVANVPVLQVKRGGPSIAEAPEAEERREGASPRLDSNRAQNFKNKRHR